MPGYITEQQAFAILLAVVGALWAMVQLCMIGWAGMVWWEIRQLRDRTRGLDERLGRIEGSMERRQPRELQA